jgi:hypothetical protein
LACPSQRAHKFYFFKELFLSAIFSHTKRIAF